MCTNQGVVGAVSRVPLWRIPGLPVEVVSAAPGVLGGALGEVREVLFRSGCWRVVLNLCPPLGRRELSVGDFYRWVRVHSSD